MDTYKIVVGIFDGSEREYPNKRYGCGDRGQRGYGRDHLKHQQTQEVKIGEPLKLLKQIQWQERQNRILGRLDVIILKRKLYHKLHFFPKYKVSKMYLVFTAQLNCELYSRLFARIRLSVSVKKTIY